MGEEVSYHIVHLHHLGHLDQLDGMYVSNAYVGFYVCMSVCISVWRRWSRRPSRLRWSRPREEEDKEEEEQEEGEEDASCSYPMWSVPSRPPLVFVCMYVCML